MRVLGALIVLLGSCIMPGMARAIEEPRYAVVQQLDGAEVREYAPYIAAEVLVTGSSGDAAGNQGFRVLAGYIFGQNKGERRIAMTAPVTQTPAPQKIAMTAPVTQRTAEGGQLVQFVMPASFTMETLPEPLDPRVQLREVPAARYAVVRFSGFWSEANYAENLERLRKAAEAAGLRTQGEPIVSRYDPPWTPWFMRRNEIWLRLD
jgi:hypothetical protein